MKKISRLTVVLVYALSLIISLFIVQAPRRAVYAQGECSVGYYPKTTNIVTNGSFAVAPSDIYPAGDPGTSFSTPGFYYANANFYSQMANAGTDVYPDTIANSNNAFSVQNGDFDGTGNGFPEVNQLMFPGDPTYNLPAVPTWLYTNGNEHAGTEYLNWEQDVSGLTIGVDYVFVAYISNLIEPPTDAAADPIIHLKIGGTTGMPDGTEIYTTTLTEAATSNTSPLNGWQRVAFSFTASATTEKLKIVDSAISVVGDDFAMTSIGLQECVEVPDYTLSLSHTGVPSVGSTFTERITATNNGPGVADNTTTIQLTLPVGYVVNGGSAGAVTITNNSSSYSCTSNAASPQIVTCTSPVDIPVSGSQFFDMAISVIGTANGAATIAGSVSVPLEDNTTNNAAIDAVTVAPDVKNTLSIPTKTATTVVLESLVENIGTSYTTGPVTITFPMPAGIVVNAGGAGNVALEGDHAADWTCASDAGAQQTITCSHTQVMQNNSSANQVFRFVLGITSGAGESLAFNSTVSTSGDSNATNNQSSTQINSASVLDNTGSDQRYVNALALVVVLGVITLGYKTKAYRAKKFSIRA